MPVTSTLRRTSVSWYVAFPEAFADWTSPTAAEMAGALVYDLTCALDEETSNLSLDDSDTDDRYSFCTEAGVDIPTFQNVTAELGFYRDADRTATGEFADAFNLLRHPDIDLFVIKRVGDQDNTPGTAVAVGDRLKVVGGRTDFGIDLIASEDPVMMQQTILPTGKIAWNVEVEA
jgi:hypothetical protein